MDAASDRYLNGHHANHIKRHQRRMSDPFQTSQLRSHSIASSRTISSQALTALLTMVFEKDPLNGIPLNIEGYKSGMTGNDRRGKHELSPEPKYKKRMHGSARNLALVEALESGKMATDMCVVRRSESPWDTFVQIYECNLAGPFIVVTHRVRPSRLLGVRVIRHKDVDQLLRRFQSLQHPNLLSTLEAYVYHQSLYMVHSDICISLTEIIACGVDLDDMQLAAILAQLLDSLLYLTEQHLRHPCLSCPNILLTATGEVKITRLEEYKELEENKTEGYSKELEVITMELMQGYEKADNKTGIDNTEQWDGSEALGFLSSVASNLPIRKLREHALLINNQWMKGHLQGLVSYASRSAFTFCAYVNL